MDGLAGHLVGVGVVIHPLVVFVGADGVVYFPLLPVGMAQQQGIIEPGALQNRLRAALGEDRMILGDLHVDHDGPGHGGGDMVLLIPEEGTHGAAGEHIGDVVIRAGVEASILAFPGIKSALPAILFCLFQRAGQRLDAVAHHGAGHLRLGVEEIVQNEHFAVPEDRPLVGLAGKSPGRDG